MTDINSLSPSVIEEAHRRIAPHLHRTPVVESERLNEWLGSRILFKAENMQRIGAFKSRGALNTLLKMKEQNTLPDHVAAFSSGNHAQGVAWSAKKLGIKATIFMPDDVSTVKIQATKGYGAEVVLTQGRKDAEDKTQAMGEKGAFILPPYDHDDVIAGQGTACYEALQDGPRPDAIFAPVGGGGLISGTWLAAQLLAPKAKVFGAEPQTGNDAARSYRQDEIFRWDACPETMADGVRTLAVSERTFHYIRQTSGIFEVTEDKIAYWTQWLTHLLKLTIEPTSSLPMDAAMQWLQETDSGKTILILLSGGNIDTAARQTVWRENLLTCPPVHKF